MNHILDNLVVKFDKTLRTLLPTWPKEALIKNPGDDVPDMLISPVEQHQSAGMMRVNLAGEVAAQGLYRGQLLVARNETLKQELKKASIEEFDHYVWCSERLKELDAKASLFNPLWYWGALSIGVMAGLLSDKVSLGFLMATEEQVGKHLASHLLNLPQTDLKSREIVARMYQDELRHAEDAQHHGGVQLPWMVQEVMHWVAQVMINTSRLI
jgi:ubiquinone biosynthesis monooxygenase Coq7